MPFRILAHDSVDSTNERAFAAIAAGTARDRDAHWALEQTAGRGRRGATWHSARGVGLYLSVVLLPAEPFAQPAALTMAAGTAVARAFRALGVPNVTLKWPNDVVVDGAKLAGILVETRGLDPQRPHYVIGIGGNVRQTSFPPELTHERAVTSLARLGVDDSIESVRDRVLAELELALDRLDAPDVLAREFLDATRLRDANVEVEVHDQCVAGILRDLSLDRGLELETADGERRRFALEFVRQVRPAATH